MDLSSRNRTLGFGLLIILAGFVILLHQYRVFPPEVDNVLISWQMLLIVIGVFNLFFAQSRFTGYILIVVGAFFLLPEVFTLPYNFKRNFWPVILILVGVFIIFRHGVGKKDPPVRISDENGATVIDEFNIFSGTEKKISTKGFRGGRITSIFGGSDIDLSEAELSSEINVIEVFYLFGGSSITVPRDWVVVNKVTAVLGGFSDSRKNIVSGDPESSKTLIIRGFVMFGGGEIKS